jgi:hypothetical protein
MERGKRPPANPIVQTGDRAGRSMAAESLNYSVAVICRTPIFPFPLVAFRKGNLKERNIQARCLRALTLRTHFPLSALGGFAAVEIGGAEALAVGRQSAGPRERSERRLRRQAHGGAGPCVGAFGRMGGRPPSGATVSKKLCGNHFSK